MKPESKTMRHLPTLQTTEAQQGVVLPIALIMLVIISFAGLLAARNSASFEQFSNNMRTNQVARVSAEDALRQCERIARSSAESSAAFSADVGKIEDATLVAEAPTGTQVSISQGLWNTRSSWAASNTTTLITVTPQYDSNVQSSAQLRNPPTCIVQAMVNDRFLITSRGLSNDAVVDAGGLLTSGSEVWLQSILTPAVPTLCPNNGVC